MSVLRSALLLGVLTFSGCGGDDSGFSNGDTIEAAIEREWEQRGGNPIAADCPNERVLKGDVVVCRILFSDGSYTDFTATVTGIEDNGRRVNIEVE